MKKALIYWMKHALFVLAMLFFVAAAFLQYNDPDGWLWAPFYLVTAAVGLLAVFKNSKRTLAAHVILILGLAIWVFTHTNDAYNPGGSQELVHEAGGLGIALLWNLCLNYFVQKKSNLSS